MSFSISDHNHSKRVRVIKLNESDLDRLIFPFKGDIIIYSLEGVFATIAAWLLINQTLDLNKIIGCVAIFFGVIIVQLLPIIKKTYDK